MANETINQQTEDTSPTSDDFLLEWDTGSGTTKKVALANIKSSIMQSNPYKFWAYQNSGQAVTTGADRLVSLQAEVFDTNNNFSTGTYLYTAPVTGFYFFSWAVTYPIINNSIVYTLLYVNGAVTNGITGQAAGQSTGGTQTVGFTGSGMLQLTAGNTVGLYVNVGNNATINAFRSQTYLQGFLVSLT